METDGTPCSVSPALIIGTAILMSAVPSFSNEYKLPIPLCNYELVQNYNVLKYSSINNTIFIMNEFKEYEPIIPLKTVKKITIKINKPTPLKIVNIQDNQGFY